MFHFIFTFCLVITFSFNKFDLLKLSDFSFYEKDKLKVLIFNETVFFV